MAIFPVEVCDLIIDQVPVSEARDDLASFAMVCRSWARRSRSRQFKSLNFTTGSSHHRLSLFLDLIASPHATIAPHVRHIILVFGGRERSIPWAELFMRIASLHALESISLSKYTHTTRGRGLPLVEEITAWLGSFANLRRMELSHFMLFSFSQLRDIVCACRGLERLCMRSVYSHVDHPIQPESSPCPPLQVLKTIDSSFDKHLFEWLRGCASASSLPLRSLCIGIDAVVRYQAPLGRLLRALGPILEELSIQCNSPVRDDHAISYQHIDLRYNTRLEVLSFLGCSLKSIQREFLGLAYQVSSSTLRELNISLDGIAIRELDNIVHAGAESLSELAAIDTLLQRPNFANLERFNIGFPRVVDSMQMFFPHTAARNVLRLMDISEMLNNSVP